MSGSAVVITITMDEGTSAPTQVAYLTGYTGTAIPSFYFNDGDNAFLGMNFKNNGSVTTLNFELEQDFENINQKSYSVVLDFEGITAYLIIKIQNIFDNPPNVVQLTNPCTVDVSEENFN